LVGEVVVDGAVGGEKLAQLIDRFVSNAFGALAYFSKTKETALRVFKLPDEQEHCAAEMRWHPDNLYLDVFRQIFQSFQRLLLLPLCHALIQISYR